MNILQSIGQEVLSALRNCNSVGEINRVLLKFAIGLGSELFQLTPGPQNPFDDEAFLAQIGNFPEELRKVYMVDAICNTDPSYLAALHQNSPLKWRNMFLQSKTQAQKDFVGKLRQWKIVDGISIPIHGPNGCIAILMFASTKILGKSAEDSDSLSLIAVAVMQRLKRIIAYRLLPNKSDIYLTLREAECLSWVLDGKTNWEIGVLVGISARTVQFHIANCARKFGVHNRIQAAIKALISGMITLPESETNCAIKRDIYSFEFTSKADFLSWDKKCNPPLEKVYLKNLD